MPDVVEQAPLRITLCAAERLLFIHGHGERLLLGEAHVRLAEQAKTEDFEIEVLFDCQALLTALRFNFHFNAMIRSQTSAMLSHML